MEYYEVMEDENLDEDEELTDEQKQEEDEDALLEELAEEFVNDPDGALERMEELGYDVDDLPL
jgi:hypothetical protein